jgi:hypothetical protein
MQLLTWVPKNYLRSGLYSCLPGLQLPAAPGGLASDCLLQTAHDPWAGDAACMVFSAGAFLAWLASLCLCLDYLAGPCHSSLRAFCLTIWKHNRAGDSPSGTTVHAQRVVIPILK